MTALTPHGTPHGCPSGVSPHDPLTSLTPVSETAGQTPHGMPHGASRPHPLTFGPPSIEGANGGRRPAGPAAATWTTPGRGPMNPVCDTCDLDIEVNNQRFPGYCSPGCRDCASASREARRRERQAAATIALERQRAAREGRFVLI